MLLLTEVIWYSNKDLLAYRCEQTTDDDINNNRSNRSSNNNNSRSNSNNSKVTIYDSVADDRLAQPQIHKIYFGEKSIKSTHRKDISTVAGQSSREQWPSGEPFCDDKDLVEIFGTPGHRSTDGAGSILLCCLS
ncbi:hypothetical protein ElyMa_003761000 [Elysia marginata]|uniref:Uncharacterized protein n=1 Tax=Elysia marginata TaxID=1093978 RepID=A0AAV4F9D3_9GAST|nr:hypothetical protein ElyMa_003761000 [Elysia marginata]